MTEEQEWINESIRKIMNEWMYEIGMNEWIKKYANE